MLLFVICLNQGCITLQLRDKGGYPRIVGFGSLKAINIRQGKLYSVSFPGIGLRVDNQNPGVSLGLHETLSFYPEELESNKIYGPIAYHNKSYGLDIGSGYFSIGFFRAFIVSTAPQNGVCQHLYYSEENPEKTIIIREDIP